MTDKEDQKIQMNAKERREAKQSVQVWKSFSFVVVLFWYLWYFADLKGVVENWE